MKKLSSHRGKSVGGKILREIRGGKAQKPFFHGQFLPGRGVKKSLLFFLLDRSSSGGDKGPNQQQQQPCRHLKRDRPVFFLPSQFSTMDGQKRDEETQKMAPPTEAAPPPDQALSFSFT